MNSPGEGTEISFSPQTTPAHYPASYAPHHQAPACAGAGIEHTVQVQVQMKVQLQVPVQVHCTVLMQVVQVGSPQRPCLSHMAALAEEGGKGQGFVLVRLLWNGSAGGAGQPHLLFFRLGEGGGYGEEPATRIEGEAGAGPA